jgi:signal peptidase I
VGGLNAVKRSLIEAFKIPAASMIPTLEIGDRVMVDKRSRQPARGDVIVFEFPLDRSTTYVKRVVALGGDTVEVRGGKLIVNGKDVWRERVQNGCPEGSADSGRPCVIWEETFDDRRYQVAIEPDPVRGDLERRLVPRGSVFVLGDNRDNTSDSRVWGPVPLENVTGTVRFIYWSTDERGQTRWDRVDAPVR